MAIGRALIDGREYDLAEARLAITDDGVARGDGAFETIGVWSGRPFHLDEHLDRLSRSLQAIGLPPTDTGLLEAEAAALLDGVGDADAALRIYVTASGTRVVTLSDPPVRREPRHLVPEPAPWIHRLGSYGPAGAKTMSYLHNMAASRAAQAAGGDDALLVTVDGVVLEGPTFCVLWASGGVVHTASLDLGIVDSITRRALLGLAAEEGIECAEGAWPLEALLEADEVFICSAVRDLIAVQRVGDRTYDAPTPVRDLLAAGMTRLRRGHTAPT